MTHLFPRRAALAGLAAAVVLSWTASTWAEPSLLDVATKSKKTGLPMFVMFSGPGRKACVEMVKQLESDAELKKLITTQFVFIETSPSGADSEKFQQVYKLKVEGIPHINIVSSKGELIHSQVGAPGSVEGLKKLLMDGIEKTGGMKSIATASTKKKPTIVTKLDEQQLADVLKQVSDAKSQIASDETALEGMVSLLGLSRAYTRIAAVKKEIGPVFADVNKDKAKKTVLEQARQLDTALKAAEENKTKQAEGLLKGLIKKYPDSAVSKLAEAKLAELSSASAGDKPAGDKPAGEKAASAETAKRG